jgi:catechol 2,3-dioxygenase-like lactoylglutathione lyase family enzyme
MMLNLVRRPVKKFPVNPRVRAYGKARLDIASRVHTPSDWEKLWKRPAFPFPFTWGVYWKQCIEYKVDDFAAEVGFYTDILGLPVNALDPGYAMFTSPGGDFFIAIVPTPQGAHSTPPDAIRIQFMVADVFATARELEQRSISMEQWPQPCADGSTLFIGYFRTPHGICVDLWGLVEVPSSPDPETPPDSSTSLDSEVHQAFCEPDEEEAADIEVKVDLQAADGQRSTAQSDEGSQGIEIEPEELLEVEYVDEDNA